MKLALITPSAGVVRLLFATCALLVLLSSSARAATVHNFDSLTAGANYDPSVGMYVFEDVPDGYAGLTWENFTVYQSGSGLFSFGGYPGGIVSGPNAIANLGGLPATIASATPFVFESAYLTSATIPSNFVTLTGFLEGSVVGVETYFLTGSPLSIAPGFGAVTRLEFTNSMGQNFALDDLTIGSAVPEPSTVWLMVGGLAALGARVRRRVRR